MTSPDPIRETIALYEKHAWILRRVLLSGELSHRLGAEASALFKGVRVIPSDVDAMWFSRRSRPDQETWELRSLGSTPFALVEVIPDTAGDDEREDLLSRTEKKIKEIALTGRRTLTAASIYRISKA